MFVIQYTQTRQQESHDSVTTAGQVSGEASMLEQHKHSVVDVDVEDTAEERVLSSLSLALVIIFSSWLIIIYIPSSSLDTARFT